MEESQKEFFIGTGGNFKNNDISSITNKPNEDFLKEDISDICKLIN